MLILASSHLRLLCSRNVLLFFFLRDWCAALLLLRTSFDTCGWLSLLSSSGGGINRGEMQPPQRRSVRVDHCRAVSTDSLFRDLYDDSEDEDDEVGYADPVQDDLYTRKMGVKPKPASPVSYDKFLPKFWTPEEDVHIQKIKLGSQRRPWYKKMQGFRCVRTLIYKREKKHKHLPFARTYTDISIYTIARSVLTFCLTHLIFLIFLNTCMLIYPFALQIWDSMSKCCRFLPLTVLSLLQPLLPVFSLLPFVFLCPPFPFIHPAVLGCSPKKSGSSSDDSDCDISPWLSSAPSPSGPSPSHSHTHEASAQTTIVVGKRSIQLHDSDDAGMF